MSKFNTGDVVQLASGSPEMSVILVNNADIPSRPILCMYWNGDKFEFERFAEATLVLVSSASKRNGQ